MAIAASGKPSEGMGLVPALRYRDVAAASAWLQNAFGFTESRTLRDGDGTVRYAQLACGNSMVMLCTVGGTAFDAYMTQPDKAAGCETQVCYVFVPDAAQHKARALAAGAEIVLDMEGGEGRGHGYACRDPEGHIWSFGTYDPWRWNAEEGGPDNAPAHTSPLRRGVAVLAAAAVTVVVCAGLFNWLNTAQSRASSALAGIENVLEKPNDLLAAEKLLRQTREELVRERSLRMQVERQSTELKDEAVREREARVGAEKAVREARASIPVTSAAVKTDATLAPVPAPGPHVCADAAQAKPVRMTPAEPAAADEIKALKAAVDRAQSELRRERQNRAIRAGTLSELQSQLQEERSGREQAERRVREALAKIARYESRRSEPATKPMSDPYMPTGFRDINRKIFPLSPVD